MALDTLGRPVVQNTMICDPSFERRLKDFDPRLKLMFDQATQRWVILEWAYDNSGWNIILKAEDKEGYPKPLGEWVFNKLFAYRQAYELKRSLGPDKWLTKLAQEAEDQRNEEEDKNAKEREYKILDDINEWRRGAREFDNRPASDVTAGYQKITPKTKKGIIPN